jgi:hypothetical protein
MSETNRVNPGATMVGKAAMIVVLSLILAGLTLELVRGGAVATAQTPPSPQNGGLFATPGQITADTYGVYLVDSRTNTMAVYQWVPGNAGKLKLVAARNCTFDLQLDEYNTEPSPAEIRQLVREGRSLNSPER